MAPICKTDCFICNKLSNKSGEEIFIQKYVSLIIYLIIVHEIRVFVWPRYIREIVLSECEDIDSAEDRIIISSFRFRWPKGDTEGRFHDIFEGIYDRSSKGRA